MFGFRGRSLIWQRAGLLSCKNVPILRINQILGQLDDKELQRRKSLINTLRPGSRSTTSRRLERKKHLSMEKRTATKAAASMQIFGRLLSPTSLGSISNKVRAAAPPARTGGRTPRRNQLPCKRFEESFATTLAATVCPNARAQA